ncbi:Zim17p, partial [Ascoidea rubescens DSM 1968]
FSSSTFKLNDNNNANSSKKAIRKFKVPNQELMIAFTCKKCNTRSSHVMSKQAYTKGTVLIECPGCNNRHLIADHLKIFGDDHITIEDILKAKGESVASTTNDLAFEDIPERLKGILGKYAKNTPEDFQNQNQN